MSWKMFERSQRHRIHRCQSRSLDVLPSADVLVNYVQMIDPRPPASFVSASQGCLSVSGVKFSGMWLYGLLFGRIDRVDLLSCIAGAVASLYQLLCSPGSFLRHSRPPKVVTCLLVIDSQSHDCVSRDFCSSFLYCRRRYTKRYLKVISVL